MRFQLVLNDFRRRFQPRNDFTLLSSESIYEVVVKHAVPAEPAVYVISSVGQCNEVVYIGKAGTMKSDGTWKNQKLSRRLCARQGKVSRQEFFRAMISETGANQLHFEWFVTVGESIILPVLAESELLQAYYDDYRRLPRYNKCI